MPTVSATVAAAHMWHGFSRCFADPQGRKVVWGEGWVRLLTGEAHPLGNFAVARDICPAGLVEAALPLAECGAPAAVILPYGVSDEAAKALTELGFADRGPMPAMSVEIERLAPAELPQGYRFVEVGADRAAEWTACAAAGYGLPYAVADALSPLYTVEDPTVTCYAAEKDGEMHATSLVVIYDGVAGIYSVATLAKARGQGLGAYVTAEPLRRSGASTGVLQASTMGYSVYKRLGFEDAGGVPFFGKA